MMSNRFLRGLLRQSAGEDGGRGPAPFAVASRGGSVAEQAGSAVVREAVGLVRELLRGIEHFVLSTPDMDAPSFLERIRRTAAQIGPNTDPMLLDCHRQWAADSLCAYGQLQRRYLGERESEMWRVLGLYQEYHKVDGFASAQLTTTLREIHDRMSTAVRLEDLRSMRERLELELKRAGNILEQKREYDADRAGDLTRQVRELQAALVSARYEAARDPLTGVYHRGQFEEQLDAILQSPGRCALAMIDIDDFKAINDAHGHMTGDEVLKFAVQEFGRLVRPGEVLGRLGGDEFVFVAPALVAERLFDRVARLAPPHPARVMVEGEEVKVRLSYSIGVTTSVPGDTTATLYERADAGLRLAKAKGKGRVDVILAPDE